MRNDNAQMSGQNGALALTVDERGVKKGVRNPGEDECPLLSSSSWSIGNEVPHLYSRSQQRPEMLEAQNQAVSNMLGDYERQIEYYTITLRGLRRALLELHQHILKATATHTSKEPETDLSLRTIVNTLITKACTEFATSKTEEPIVAICKILRNTYPQLTRSESKVAAYVLCGFATADIAIAFSISERTVENHRLHIRQKLAVSSNNNLKSFLQYSFNKLP